MNRKLEEEILLRYKNGEASAEEQELVENWIVNGLDFGFDLTDEELSEDLTIIRNRLNLQQPPKQKAVLWQRIAVAASIILVTAFSISIYILNSQNKAELKAEALLNDKPAGGNVAMLTLSDGSTVKLDSSINTIKRETGIEIANDTEGNLTYKSSELDFGPHSDRFNTVSTPRGGTYKVILSDGTKVWLNAASSLYFPVAFSDDSRLVELSGEGYFEVAKSNKKFIVKINNTNVEVLGTHFNVNGYANELSNNITLVEGSVKVAEGKSSAILKPKDQAEINPLTNTIKVKHNVDTEYITAWKDGTFKFHDTDLQSIMRQLERWYDIDVDAKSIPNKRFNGTISKDASLSQVLSMIEITSNLHFKIEGRSVKVK